MTGTGHAIDQDGGIRVSALNQVNGGELQVMANADRQVLLHLSFGNVHNTGHTCEVTLARSLSNRNVWVGTLTSSFDQ